MRPTAAAQQPPKPAKRKLPDSAKLGLEQLKNCLADHATDVPPSSHVKSGTKGVLIKLWRSYLVSAGLINPDGNPREQFRRMNVTLQGGGYIGVERNGFAVGGGGIA